MATDSTKELVATSDQQQANTRSWLLLSVSIAILAAFWIQAPRLVDPYSIEEDARSFFWWQRLADEHLFVDDPLEANNVKQVDLGPIRLIVYAPSPGYSLLFQTASVAVQPILFSKILVFPLLLLSVYFLFRIGMRISNPRRATLLCVSYIIFDLASSTEISTVGGLQRSFMIPLLLAICLYLMERRWWTATVFIVLCAAFYPPALLIGVAVYGLRVLDDQLQSWQPRVALRRLGPLLVACVLAGLFLLPALDNQFDKAAEQAQGDVVESGDGGRLFTDPRFQSGGRRELFTVFPLVGRGGIAVDPQTVVHIFVLAVAALITWRLRPESLGACPRTLKLLFIAGTLCYLIAWTIALISVSFLLYLPSRYTRVSILLFLFIYVVVNLPQTVKQLARWLANQRGQVFLVTIPLALMTVLLALFRSGPITGAFDRQGALLLLLGLLALALSIATLRRGTSNSAGSQQTGDSVPRLSGQAKVGLSLLLFLPAVLYMQLVHDDFYVSTPTERQLYPYLETLPPDVMIGGSPCSIDAIPIFAGRRILFSCEDPHPDPILMLDALEAYYAESASEVATFCREYGVDLLVVNENDFGEEQIASGKYFFEPFDSQLRPILASRSHFALNDVGSEKRLFESGNLYVVDCAELGG